VCGDGLDNDCDGTVDDGCVCAPGTIDACYEGPAGTEGVGTCAAGSHVCNADGSGYGPCEGSVAPVSEVCGDGLDNDCDGFADGLPGCQPEICGNGVDDDADGLTDCAEPDCQTSASCHTATEYFCNDGLDNDADGLIDANEPACSWAVSALPCAPGKLQAYRFAGPVTLPDPGTRIVSLVVPGPGTVGTVAVRVNITHSFDADVDIALESSLSTRVDLSSDNGAAGHHFQNTVFVDSAPVSIFAGAPPFAGSFRPEVALSTLAGQPVSGTWRGLVADDVVGFQGTLHEYALAICIQ
jgi:subtilisin-like proprotein convertase family protein